MSCGKTRGACEEKRLTYSSEQTNNALMTIFVSHLPEYASLWSSFGFTPMQINSVLRKHDAKLHWTARCLIRVCLLLSLWNLPLPWLHHHELNEAAADGSSWLLTHIDEFHTEVDEEDGEHGWHLHFVYFGCGNSNTPLDCNYPFQNHFTMQETSPPFPVSESIQCSFQLLQNYSAAGLMQTLDSHLSLSDSPTKDCVPNEQFLQSFQNRSLRDLISVARC